MQPYKDELLPLWRFRTPDVARESAAAIRARFDEYLAAGDLVGADVARKFLQMGYTRARGATPNHPGGRKYDGPVPPEQRGNSGAHGRRIPARARGRRQGRIRPGVQGGLGRGGAGRRVHAVADRAPVPPRLTDYAGAEDEAERARTSLAHDGGVAEAVAVELAHLAHPIAHRLRVHVQVGDDRRAGDPGGAATRAASRRAGPASRASSASG